MRVRATVKRFVLGAVLLLADRAAAQTSGAAFMGVTPSARSYALGMANGLTALGAEAIGANPANIGLMERSFQVFSSYASLMDGTGYEHLAAAFSPQGAVPIFDGVGVSVTRIQSSGFQGADAAGNQTGFSFSYGGTAAAVSASARLSSSLRLGVGGKLIQSSAAGYSSKAAPAADLGLTYTLAGFSQPLSIGVSVTNAGPGIKFLQQTDRLPTTLNMGAAVPLGPVMAVCEVNRLIYQKQVQASVGLEIGVGAVSFRAGYLAQSQSGNLALQDQKGGAFLWGLSGGVGLRIGAMRLDYALSQQAGDYGTTHRVALSLGWGSAGAQRAQTRSSDSWTEHPDRSDWMIRAMGNY